MRLTTSSEMFTRHKVFPDAVDYFIMVFEHMTCCRRRGPVAAAEHRDAAAEVLQPPVPVPGRRAGAALHHRRAPGRELRCGQQPAAKTCCMRMPKLVVSLTCAPASGCVSRSRAYLSGPQSAMLCALCMDATAWARLDDLMQTTVFAPPQPLQILSHDTCAAVPQARWCCWIGCCRS